MAGRPPLPSSSSTAVKNQSIKRWRGRSWRPPSPPRPPPPPLHDMPCLEITIDGYTITKLPPRKIEETPNIPDPYGFEAFRVKLPEDPPASMFIEVVIPIMSKLAQLPVSAQGKIIPSFPTPATG